MTLTKMVNGEQVVMSPDEEAEFVADQAAIQAALPLQDAQARLALATQQFPDWAEDIINVTGVAGKLSPDTQALLAAKQQANAALAAITQPTPQPAPAQTLPPS